MSCVNITNVQILNNPSKFTSPISFNIMFECLNALPEEIQWKLIYIGSAKDESKDQILDCFQMDLTEPGVLQFTLEASAPRVELIPIEELFKLTAIILTISYRQQEFYRLGYYVHYEYPDLPEVYSLKDLDLNSATRYIISDKPRITKIPITWESAQIKDQQRESTQGSSILSSQFSTTTI